MKDFTGYHVTRAIQGFWIVYCGNSPVASIVQIHGIVEWFYCKERLYPTFEPTDFVVLKSQELPQ